MKQVIAKIPYIVIKEARSYTAYSPALDLSSCGKSYKEAQQMFHKAATLFVTELDKMGTLEEVLQECGWKKVGKELLAPEIVGNESDEIILEKQLAHA